MKTLKSFLYILALLFFPSIVLAQTVTPGKLYHGWAVDIHAPNSRGWTQIQESHTGIAFARSGKAKNESYIAQVELFSIPEIKTRDEFVALIKRGAENDSPPDRFTTLEANFEYTEERGYPCVLFKGVSEDKKAKTSFFGHGILTLQVQSLYCRHPSIPNIGFMIGLSHRGTTVDANLGELADDFIKGGQVSQTEPAVINKAEPQ